jgi:tetraacyldisaccharide 4'-kinase
MKFKKPIFWDLKEPNILAYLLFPLSLITLLKNKLKNKSKKKYNNIKTICVGNIYVGGTGKTPLTLEINSILKGLNYKTAFIKKYYKDQIDEQKILSLHGKLFCEKKRIESINKALLHDVDVAIFDDGLQDNSLKYDVAIACFNLQSWIGNGMLIPAGPLRENLKNLINYDAVFLNGNKENSEDIKNIIRIYNSNLKIFETNYSPVNLSNIDNKYNYYVFSGIGNPDTFKKTLENNKINIVKFLEFPDHYDYTDADIKKIKNEAKEFNAKILTTEKDFMRLNDSNAQEINFFKIKLNIINKKEFINFLKNFL